MKKNKGFTLIELLVVLAVLGVLIIIVYAAINPVEIINRGKDTASKADAEQFLSGIDRFYTQQTFYPWQINAKDKTHVATAWGVVDNAWVDAAASPAKVLDKLSTGTAPEIKLAFVKKIVDANYNSLYKYNAGATGNATYICFSPMSASFKKEATDRCGTDCAGLPTDLTSAGCATLCPATGTPFYCLP